MEWVMSDPDAKRSNRKISRYNSWVLPGISWCTKQVVFFDFWELIAEKETLFKTVWRSKMDRSNRTRKSVKWWARKQRKTQKEPNKTFTFRCDRILGGRQLRSKGSGAGPKREKIIWSMIWSKGWIIYHDKVSDTGSLACAHIASSRWTSAVNAGLNPSWLAIWGNACLGTHCGRGRNWRLEWVRDSVWGLSSAAYRL